jgi:starch synthase (maltosyl-transferring)
MPAAPPERRPPRIQIEHVSPQLDCGRYAPKVTVFNRVDVGADVFRDGHEVLRAAVIYRPPARAGGWLEAPMTHHGADRWHGSFEVNELGRWAFGILAWVDRWASWRHELERKFEAGQEDLSSELAEGLKLLREIDPRNSAVAFLESSAAQEDKVEAALAVEVEDRHELTRLSRALEIDVDRKLARVGAWYELFPRSWGGFAGVEKALPELAELGFDVVYLPPIHPIGTTNRKGPNNTLTAAPGDPGSPWAIGGPEGGHDAINPELGTAEEFRRLVARGKRLGVEICLDFAIQCSPDHPWLEEHPEWFHRRPDGTLKYAENPPKRYQDIYNLNFDSEDWQSLWLALLGVVLHWVGEGVTVFRVDNPHTKPLGFWEWLIHAVRDEQPEVVFLSEAFTRPAMMQALAKAGFSQSYTYFTWKNTRRELQEFMAELVGWSAFYRPNFFVNTPDILHAYLQQGGRPAFEARLVLAATLSPSYGIYSGYEHFENVPVREGSEEYVDSEKYEIKHRHLDGPLLPLIERVNLIRHENPALQELSNITFLETNNEALIAYAKHAPANVIVVVVNLDPHNPHGGSVVIPAHLGLPPAFVVHDLLSGDRWDWRIGPNYVHLQPPQAHVFRVE